ncbi:MAG: FAD-binding oxidoreductase, partial [Rikenellaceae bacterium]|nr:FAD-binding oxidoreductase [Rikenellaceae bacterium]
RYAIVAAGFEAGRFLPENVMKLTSTYAIISQPVDERHLWPGRALLWETGTPYLYVRTDGNRILVGGGDVDFRDPVRRDKLLRKKVAVLERKFRKLFPAIPFVTDMAWCGTFSSTADGLPLIGPWPGHPRMLYALGYGGNGITFSMIAAQVLTNLIAGADDPRREVFGFQRLSVAPKR